MKQNILNNILFSYIAKSNVHGMGLFAQCDLSEGMILGTLDGQVINWDLFNDIYDSIDCDKLYKEWNALSTDTLLVRLIRTKYSFINHSREPNLCIMYHPIRIVTNKRINKDDELFLDYTREPLRKEYIEEYGKNYL